MQPKMTTESENDIQNTKKNDVEQFHRVAIALGTSSVRWKDFVEKASASLE